MDLREVGYDDRDWINLAQDRDRWRAYVFAEYSHFPYRHSTIAAFIMLYNVLYLFSSGVPRPAHTAAERTTASVCRNLPNRESNPVHLVSQPDALTVTPQVWTRQGYIPAEHNIKYPLLVQREKIFIPPLHIQLGPIKKFVKALDKNGEAFQYLKTLFPKISDDKLKEGIFVALQIRKLLKDSIFEKRLNPKEFPAWKSFASVVKGYLGNHKAENYRELLETLLRNYKKNWLPYITEDPLLTFTFGLLS
ncbi:hypothetical protein ANN_13074 [Periplaneta americana]|uniref:Uncharacterized protein n=1 Tax=Periplaneta americana TaxID=6978 RepID=A0ABQ8TJD5_PERAM|nr:hypothetical protein ANN_13074 [Periplaneta americana]